MAEYTLPYTGDEVKALLAKINEQQIKIEHQEQEITTLRDSISCGDPITLYGSSSSTTYVYAQRVGRTCTLAWKVNQPSADYLELDHVIPEGLRPTDSIYVPSCVTNMEGYVLNVCAYCFVDKNGTVGFQVASGTANAVNRGVCSWVVG